MIDVDGVLVDGRPEDGLHWQTSMEEEFAFTPDELHRAFFAPHWEDIVLGRAGVMEHLSAALQEIAPDVSSTEFLAYWLKKDSRLFEPLLRELAVLRATGIMVYLATNQEHVRAAYLMEELQLAESVDGIFYSAKLGVKKPDAAFFSKVQTIIGVASEEILLVDDSQPNVAAALKAGWQALHWTGSSSAGILRTLCICAVSNIDPGKST